MKTLKVLGAAALSILIAACAVEKSETPLAPTVAGPIAGVQITPPKPLEPASGARIPGDRQPLTLLLENASSNSPRPLSYLFEIATEPGFSNRVFAQDNVPPGDGGRTALQLPATLTMGRVYYWRAKALDGANESPFSNPNDFNVYTPVAFDKPTLISPINNDKTANQRPNFAFSTARAPGLAGLGQLRDRNFVRQRLRGEGGRVAVRTRLPGSQQTFASAADLPGGVQLFWHARAFESPVIGPWSDTAVVPDTCPDSADAERQDRVRRQADRARAKPSRSTLSNAAAPSTGAHMSSDQVVVFEKAVASDLNKSSIGGGPYGLLRKTSGASCGGYACDIICAGDGSGQRTVGHPGRFRRRANAGVERTEYGAEHPRR